ncbi:MAG TPA: hypothetical protein VKQ07_01030, partial [Jatrophihabitantaceae bacterium]|nr:hypothetical protein [Jatrophihabitantaceae bacterium]
TRRRSAVIYSVIVLAVAAAAGVTLKAVWDSGSSTTTYSHCTVGGYDLDTSQASVAASMVAAVTSYSPHLPDRAAVLALAAGLQESKLVNLPPGAGDRDSVGVLQQRPSQGWGGGDPAVLEDVYLSTREFLDHLVTVPNWRALPLADAVQRVQISADGSAYAQHETEATALASALLGRTAEGITCMFAKPTQVAATTSVEKELSRELPVHTPQVTATTISVPGAGWQTVGWLLSNADRYGIDSVSYKGAQWTRAKGWKADKAATTSAVTATMAVLKKS